jgi:hypothetical protein
VSGARPHASCCYHNRGGRSFRDGGSASPGLNAEADLEIRGEERSGYKVLTVSTAVPNSIAAICLAMRNEFGLIPHVYFDWTEGSR